MLIADAGYDNNMSTIGTSRKLVSEKKDLVQRFVTDAGYRLEFVSTGMGKT